MHVCAGLSAYDRCKKGGIYSGPQLDVGQDGREVWPISYFFLLYRQSSNFADIIIYIIQKCSTSLPSIFLTYLPSTNALFRLKIQFSVNMTITIANSSIVF